ncbi:MAG: NAD(P)-dependent oxidoreductase [bacterium]|nr:NAD(P)-dependent oxidoreductase [bacterium]
MNKKGKILITDSLFIFREHEKMLCDVGYEVERLDKPDSTENELIQAVKGKVGYILGGIEKITDKVIDAADELKAIAFTGADWRNFIPGHVQATARGISIASTPGANTYAVAEYTVTIILAMTRNIFELGRTGEKKFQTVHSLNELTVGVVGMGHIGTRVTKILIALGVKKILYYSRTRKPDIERDGVEFVDMETLLQNSDIVTLHASKEVGADFIGRNELSKMKDSALLVNCGFTGGVNVEALFQELKTGRIRAAQDDPMGDDRFGTLPLSVWFNSNSHTAFNTFEANKIASDMSTESLINLLSVGMDQYKVN